MRLLDSMSFGEELRECCRGIGDKIQKIKQLRQRKNGENDV